MALKQITDKDLIGKGVLHMEDTPNLTALEMQKKVEEVVRTIVIPVMNENTAQTATLQDLGEAIQQAGGGDMSTLIYDPNKDGSVLLADVAHTLDGKHADELFMLSGGTAIYGGVNLNAYQTIGNYYCNAASNAVTILNCPVKTAFTMQIFKGTGVDVITQRVRDFHTGDVYERYLQLNNVWTKWKFSSGIQLIKLWENASPTSSFSSQIIHVDLSAYWGAYVEFHTSTGAPYKLPLYFVKKGNSGFVNYIADKAVVRNFIPRSDGISFGDCSSLLNYGGGTIEIVNTNIIPFIIYGIKGVEDV